MAAPCKKHLTNEEVYEMYSLIARRSISLNTRYIFTNKKNNKIEICYM